MKHLLVSLFMLFSFCVYSQDKHIGITSGGSFGYNLQALKPFSFSLQYNYKALNFKATSGILHPIKEKFIISNSAFLIGLKTIEQKRNVYLFNLGVNLWSPHEIFNEEVNSYNYYNDYRTEFSPIVNFSYRRNLAERHKFTFDIYYNRFSYLISYSHGRRRFVGFSAYTLEFGYAYKLGKKRETIK